MIVFRTFNYYAYVSELSSHGMEVDSRRSLLHLDSRPTRSSFSIYTTNQYIFKEHLVVTEPQNAPINKPGKIDV